MSTMELEQIEPKLKIEIDPKKPMSQVIQELRPQIPNGTFVAFGQDYLDKKFYAITGRNIEEITEEFYFVTSTVFP